MSTLEPDSSRSRQQPEETSERRLTAWQRALRWVLWLGFLGAAAYNSQSVRFSGLEWLLLAAAVTFSIWCMAKPMGGELEKTHAYALFLLLIPGLIMLCLNLIPLLNRGSSFRVEADGTTIGFTAPQGGPPEVALPQAWVFREENGARLKSELSAAFFTALLTGRGFDVDATSGRNAFAARRK